MTRRRVEPEELRDMLRRRKMTHADIAKETGLTVAGVKSAIYRYKLGTERIGHKEALPWTLAEEHSMGKVPSYLRFLSTVGQKKTVFQAQAKTAISWAQAIVDQGLDVDYDREVPPEESIHLYGGFYTKKADPADWHLKRVLDKAKRGYAQIY